MRRLLSLAELGVERITPVGDGFHDQELAEVAAKAKALDAKMMFGSTFEELAITAQGDGAALNTSTTATSILPGAAKLVIPAGYLWRVGQHMRVVAAGRISNIVTTPGTITLDLRMTGGSTVVVANGGATSMNTTAKTNVAWMLWWDLTLRAIGTTANWMHQGEFCSESVVGSAAGVANTAMLPASAPAVGTNFDATVNQILDLFATFSISNAANSIQLHQLAVYLST